MRRWLCLVLGIFWVHPAWAGDADGRRSLNRLERVTGGSSDHYQSVVSPAHDEIFFSRGWKLSTQIYRQPLGPVALGQGMTPWAPEDFDSKDPALSPSGLQIAYVSFRYHARGQICIEPTERAKALGDRCLKPGRGSVSQPSWLNERELFFLTSEPGSVLQQLTRYDLTTGQQDVVVKDSIFAFSVHPSGRYVVYTSQPKPGAKTLDKVLKVRGVGADASAVGAAQVRVDLPGLPGFPAFDPIGEYLYFSQYLEDSNGDGRINGNDNSVVFRIVANKLTTSTKLRVAEQLTTFEQDCSYLHPTRERLFLTCASRDNLDVYTLPRDGVVPAGWSVDTLEEAYRVSRSVSERSLLLNVMRFRFSGYESAATLERMVSNYVVSREFGAARYYLDHLIDGEDSASDEALRDAKLWVELRRRARLEQVGDLSDSFLTWVRKREEALGEPKSAFGNVVAAALRVARGDGAGAAEVLSAVRVADLDRAFAQYVYTDVTRSVIGESETGAATEREALAWEMTHSDVLSTENLVYYTCVYLDSLAERLTSDQERYDAIEARLTEQIAPQVGAVLAVEQVSLLLGMSDDEKAKKKLLGDLVKLIAKTKDQYFVQRAVYVRAVVHLMARDRHKEAGQVASQWLSRVGKTSLEFTYAKQHYVETSFDKAYGHVQSQKTKWASEIFYSTMASTDEPEAHMGYTVAMVKLGDVDKLEKTYERLVSRGLTGENVRLVEAIRLVTAAPTWTATSVDAVRSASRALEAMDTNGLNPALPNFLLGALYHLELIKTRSGLGFDGALAEKAHRQYMLAYDQVGDNDRLLASLLSNLGALHQLTRNFGVAATYLEQRSRVGFVTPIDEAMHALALARSLYYSGEHGRSADESARAFALVEADPAAKGFLAAFAGKAGFYHMAAERWEAALGFYDSQLGYPGGAKGDQALRARLNSGYCQVRLGLGEAARTTLESLVKVLGNQPDLRKHGLPDGLKTLQPSRVAVLARGLLAQVTDDGSRVEQLRAERMAMMERWLDDPSAFASNELSILGFLARDCNGIAKLQLERGALTEARVTMAGCAGWAQSLSDAGASPLNPDLRGTVINRLMILLHTDRAEAEPSFLTLAASTEAALAPLADSSPEFARDWVRLRVLRYAYEYGRSLSACELHKEQKGLAATEAVALLRAQPQSGVEQWLDLISLPCGP